MGPVFCASAPDASASSDRIVNSNRRDAIILVSENYFSALDSQIPELDERSCRILGMRGLQADRTSRPSRVAHVDDFRAVIEHDDVIARQRRLERVPLAGDNLGTVRRVLHVHDAAGQVFTTGAISEHLVANLQLVACRLRPSPTQHERGIHVRMRAEFRSQHEVAEVLLREDGCARARPARCE